MVAARHNPTLKRFHQRLIAAGKPKLVALIATAGKLLTALNAILKGRQWPTTASPQDSRSGEVGERRIELWGGPGRQRPKAPSVRCGQLPQRERLGEITPACQTAFPNASAAAPACFGPSTAAAVRPGASRRSPMRRQIGFRAHRIDRGRQFRRLIGAVEQDQLRPAACSARVSGDLRDMNSCALAWALARASSAGSTRAASDLISSAARRAVSAASLAAVPA